MTSKKHPLHTPWTLWHFSTPNQFKPNNYSEYLRVVSTFKYVEDFWCVFSHIVKPANLKPNDAMMMFRENVQPEWEDPSNQAGGEWRVSFPPAQFSKTIDSCWENLLMWVIGEIFSHSEEVMGVYLKIKQKGGKDRVEYRVSLWTKNSTDDFSDVIMSLGNEMKACFGPRPEEIPRLEFRPHTDNIGDSTGKKQKFRIEGASMQPRSKQRLDSRGGHPGRGGDRRNEPPHGHFSGRGGYPRQDSRGGSRGGPHMSERGRPNGQRGSGPSRGGHPGRVGR